MQDAEILNQAAPPKISDDGIAFYRSLLNNAGWVEANPNEAAALRQSVDQAFAATGQSFDPPSDGRSAAQQLHDRRYGVTITQAGKPELREHLQTAIDREAGGQAPDSGEIATQLEAVGLDYKSTLAAAQIVLDEVGSAVKATALSAPVLAQCGVWAGHLARAKAERPK